uniref:Serine/threonine-protein phosphatase n=2 Tax=Hemiselmis andersenii TaxID=464988 RepID=A0A7S0U557_HEMAN|mmetsp:Transcript_38665/g.90071  ORF Transcript_38665/g.90071 Transcript_38665/m.90071 type:complete len:888 (+) Transcript_38665:78-2741(+)
MSQGKEEAIAVGQKVVILGKRKGTVRFIGSTAFGPGEWVGIELEKPTGSHDGGVNGQRYFSCPAGHGVYVQRAGVLPSNSWQAAASQIQSLLRGRKDRQETDYKRAFQTWNAMDMEEESQFLDQSATITRVEHMLRAYHPASSATPNGNSAVALSISGGLSPNSMDWGADIQIEPGYEGPHITWPLTLSTVENVLHHIRTKPEIAIHKKYVAEVVGRACDLMGKQLKDSVYDMAVPSGSDGKLVICGDTHGQLADFLWVLKQNGEPSPTTGYLLNGDVADRGEDASEILMISLLYKLLYPDNVMINRGNHENLEMNRRALEHGGGFFDECKRKYDATIFMMFQQLFEIFPLATVVSKRVFVVHGGLFRRDGVLVQHIRTINRRRQCPTSTEAIEDALMFDCMWADPQDFPGVSRAAHRGANCIRFGPDVTKRFLGNNSLSLCIRSHEVPNSLRGFEDKHDGRLITVFTASNYCGQTGNYGAVVIFHSDMSYTVEEHMAPSLDSLVQEYSHSGMTPSRTDEPVKQVTAEDMNASMDKMNADIMEKLRQKIVQHKDDLWWYWMQIDTKGTGKVSAAHWRQGMSSALQLDLPWFNLQKTLCKIDAQGNIDYKEFLDQSQPDFAYDQAGFEPGWENKVVLKFYENMLKSDMTLKQTLSMFDSDGDGLVSPTEFRQALNIAQSGLPEPQVNAILRLIDRDDSGRLKVADFLDRFQVVYSSGKSDAEKPPKEVQDNLSKIGRLLIGSEGTRVATFEKIDINGDGYVDQSEFLTAVKSLKLQLSDQELAQVWKVVDANGDGHLNYLEFCAAFQVEDKTGTKDQALRGIIDSILASLQKNSMSLAFAFRYFDPTGQGTLKRDDFKAGMKALNASNNGPSPCTDEQLDVLCDFIDA